MRSIFRILQCDQLYMQMSFFYSCIFVLFPLSIYITKLSKYEPITEAYRFSTNIHNLSIIFCFFSKKIIPVIQVERLFAKFVRVCILCFKLLIFMIDSIFCDVFSHLNVIFIKKKCL